MEYSTQSILREKRAFVAILNKKGVIFAKTTPFLVFLKDYNPLIKLS